MKVSIVQLAIQTNCKSPTIKLFYHIFDRLDRFAVDVSLTSFSGATLEKTSDQWAILADHSLMSSIVWFADAQHGETPALSYCERPYLGRNAE